MSLWGDPNRNKKEKKKVRIAKHLRRHWNGLHGNDNEEDYIEDEDLEDEADENVRNLLSGQIITDVVQDFTANCAHCGSWLKGSGSVGQFGIYCNNKCMKRAGDSH